MEGELLRPFITFEQVFPNSGHCVNIFSHRFVPWPINVPENRENARGVRFDSSKISESKTASSFPVSFRDFSSLVDRERETIIGVLCANGKCSLCSLTLLILAESGINRINKHFMAPDYAGTNICWLKSPKTRSGKGARKSIISDERENNNSGTFVSENVREKAPRFVFIFMRRDGERKRWKMGTGWSQKCPRFYYRIRGISTNFGTLTRGCLGNGIAHKA